MSHTVIVESTGPSLGWVADCGAAVCVEHSVSAPHWLTRTQLVNRVERIDPPARVIRCGTCHAAHAARGDVAAAVPAPSPTR